MEYKRSMHRIMKLLSTGIIRMKCGSFLEMNGVQEFSFHTRIKASGRGHLKFGKNTVTIEDVSFYTAGGNIIIGDRCSFNKNCMVVSRECIEIGNACSFGPNVCIYDHDHLFDGRGVDQSNYKCRKVSIGSNCWVGANVVILKGSSIGDGSVIGAGTVIKGEIPAHSIVTSSRTLQIRKLENH